LSKIPLKFFRRLPMSSHHDVDDPFRLTPMNFHHGIMRLIPERFLKRLVPSFHG
jgi:hypothetical protein